MGEFTQATIEASERESRTDIVLAMLLVVTSQRSHECSGPKQRAWPVWALLFPCSVVKFGSRPHKPELLAPAEFRTGQHHKEA